MQLIQRSKRPFLCFWMGTRSQREPTKTQCGRSCERDGGGHMCQGFSGEQPSQTSWVFSYFLVLTMLSGSCSCFSSHLGAECDTARRWPRLAPNTPTPPEHTPRSGPRTEIWIALKRVSAGRMGFNFMPGTACSHSCSWLGRKNALACGQDRLEGGGCSQHSWLLDSSQPTLK